MTMQPPALDVRFVNIGDLPTGFTPYGFKELYVREFTLAELKLLYIGMHSRTKPIEHIVRAVQHCCTVPVGELTDGDFEFLLAWLRMHSYPKAPLQVNWKCMKENLVYKKGRDFWRGPKLSLRDMALKGIELEVCQTNNVETVQAYRTKIVSLDDDDLYLPYDDIDFPRVATMSDFHMHVEENPHDRHMAECARWVKKGSTFRAKMVYLLNMRDNDLYERIQECRKRYHHGVIEVMNLRCRVCDHRWEHQTAPHILSFFADNTEEDIFKIQYNLLSEFGMPFDMNMPAKLFLFNYSSLAKDRRDAAERKNGFKPLA